ncbi:MAG: protein kinase [Bacteroidia bacterium]|nr:protein kinase [Bacteroidia bacterium]
MSNTSAVLSNGVLLQNGRYRIEKILGQGGFGITYLVKQTALQADFVVKEFFLGGFCIRKEDNSVIPQSMKPEDFLKYKERFLQEAQYLYKLRGNKNIVEVSDYFEENGTAYMVMPFIADENLEQYTRRQPGNRLPEPEVFSIANQLSSALREIHAHQILHRDIKPSNILRKADGSVVLIDFGSARELLTGDISQTMSTIISAGFAPPEQYNISAKRGPFSDIYSLGATLYRLVTGKMPADATSRTMEDLEEPGVYVPSLSASMNAAIMKAMELRPQNRYQTVGEFMQALQAPVQEDRTMITASPVTQTITTTPADNTRINIKSRPVVSSGSGASQPEVPFYKKPLLWIPASLLMIAGLGWGASASGIFEKKETEDPVTDTLTAEVPPKTDTIIPVVKVNPSYKADSLKMVQRHKFVEDSLKKAMKDVSVKEQDKKFQEVKAEADIAYKGKQYKVAMLKYDLALMYKPTDAYCAKQKAICEQKIRDAALEQQVVIKNPPVVHETKPVPTPSHTEVPPPVVNTSTTTKGKLYNLRDDTGQPYDYEGEIRNNKPNGKGQMQYKNGSTCDGTFTDGNLNGYCECKFDTGDRYMGNARKDRMNGQGKYIYKNGNRYEGNFVDDRMEGKGKFVFTNGEYFTGTFKNDLPEGIVEYHNIYGKVIRGTIRGDQFYPENEPANPSQKLQKIFKPH